MVRRFLMDFEVPGLVLKRPGGERRLTDILHIAEILQQDSLKMDGFFFSSRRRHTRWTGDWSSDVCSSDLLLRQPSIPKAESPVRKRESAPGRGTTVGVSAGAGAEAGPETGSETGPETGSETGRSEERRVGKEGSTRRWAKTQKNMTERRHA